MSKDTIYRQDAIDAVFGRSHEIIKMRIGNLPSAQPKTGHWIMTHDYFTGAYESIDYVKCSCCGEDSLEAGDYCPNCGAKMVEPQESEG